MIMTIHLRIILSDTADVGVGGQGQHAVLSGGQHTLCRQHR